MMYSLSFSNNNDHLKNPSLAAKKGLILKLVFVLNLLEVSLW